MEKLVHKGKARAIGISNFTPTDIELILKECSIPPADHQVESHPYLQQPKFAEYHKEKGIHVTQFSPMGPKLKRKTSLPSPLEDPTVLQVAEKYGKTPAQVVLGWGIAHGRSVIPKASSAGRIEENLGSDFRMDPADLAKLDALDKKIRMNNPAGECNVEIDVFRGLPDE
jgi:diketogulonate reductase-like aldo/keto reductase